MKALVYKSSGEKSVESNTKKVTVSRLLKSIIVVFMFSIMIAMMTSCYWGRYGGHEGGRHHEGGERHHEGGEHHH